MMPPVVVEFEMTIYRDGVEVPGGPALVCGVEGGTVLVDKLTELCACWKDPISLIDKITLDWTDGKQSTYQVLVRRYANASST